MTTSGTIGVLGHDWRADVTVAGTIEPWDGSAPMAWHVAADDRWHTPASEPTVRQLRLLGAPVFETRVRIPGGDAVQRIWSVAGGGGCTVVELANDSPLPLAGAFTRTDLMTSRPPTDVPIRGIDLDAATVLPVGHRAAVTVALAHDGRGRGPLPADLPTADATARGWVTLTERASRLSLPDVGSVELVVAARCDVLLAGPPSPADDPAGHLLALGELLRMGELDDDAVRAVVPAVATAVHDIAARPGWDVDAALAAAGGVLARGGERRAVRDIARIVAARPPSLVMDRATGVRAVAAVERRLATGPVLLPAGIPGAWRGASIEAHGLPVGPSSTVSFAIRWHGEHPAVLWEVEGEPVELSAPAVDPSWRTSRRHGEALWRSPV